MEFQEKDKNELLNQSTNSSLQLDPMFRQIWTGVHFPPSNSEHSTAYPFVLDPLGIEMALTKKKKSVLNLNQPALGKARDVLFQKLEKLSMTSLLLSTPVK